jgi:hypothetical protein
MRERRADTKENSTATKKALMRRRAITQRRLRDASPQENSGLGAEAKGGSSIRGSSKTDREHFSPDRLDHLPLASS